MKNKEPITTWVILRDTCVFEGCFDDEESAKEKLKSFSRYLGYFRIIPMTDKMFKKFMRGTLRIISDPLLAHAYGMLDRRFTR